MCVTRNPSILRFLNLRTGELSLAIKKGKRELVDTGSSKRFVKRNAEGTFKESVQVGRSLAADRRGKAKTTVISWLRRPGRSGEACNKEIREEGREEIVKEEMTAMPSVVEPMAPTLAKQPFSNPAWIFEPKWDGYRAICFLQDEAVLFASRNRKSLTEWFPDLQRIAKSIKAKTAILDGEIVALDAAGVPCFDGLRSRTTAADCVIVYYAFDLLHLDGRDLTKTPLIERKATLKKILSKSGTGRLRYTDHMVGDGEQLFAELEKRNLEGMVAKRSDSLYVGGRTRAWVKIKTSAGREEMQKRSEAWNP